MLSEIYFNYNYDSLLKHLTTILYDCGTTLKGDSSMELIKINV